MNVFHLNRSRFRRLPGCAAIVAAFWLGIAEIETPVPASNREQVAPTEGIDRLILLTGYTIAMLHQSKTLVDAAADSGVGLSSIKAFLGTVGRPIHTLHGTRWWSAISKAVASHGRTCIRIS